MERGRMEEANVVIAMRGRWVGRDEEATLWGISWWYGLARNKEGLW
jgi:hypothetical protein